MSQSVLQAHFIVDEMLMNGRIVETNKQNVLAPVQLLDKALWSRQPVQQVITLTTASLRPETFIASRSSKHVASGHVEIQFDYILEHRTHLPICLLSWLDPLFITCKRKGYKTELCTVSGEQCMRNWKPTECCGRVDIHRLAQTHARLSVGVHDGWTCLGLGQNMNAHWNLAKSKS